MAPSKEEQLVELTPEQESAIETIKEQTKCPKDFECCTSKFETLSPVRRFFGINLIECQSEDKNTCPMSSAFGGDIRLCGCPLRKHLAFELGK